MSGFGIFAPDGTLLATHEHVEQATLAARTRHVGRVGWIERLSDGALIGAPGGLKDVKRPKRAPLPLPEPATLQEAPVVVEVPALLPAPVKEPPQAPVEPPTEEARVLAALSADTWRTRAEVAQLAGLEEETAGWVLLRLLDAGQVRWARATWALPP